jgi:3-oxoacyl-[acyl-carrier-protein] synthase III
MAKHRLSLRQGRLRPPARKDGPARSMAASSSASTASSSRAMAEPTTRALPPPSNSATRWSAPGSDDRPGWPVSWPRDAGHARLAPRTGTANKGDPMIRSSAAARAPPFPGVMKNADFEGVVETSDEWIVQRTGIRQRHIAADDETTASLGRPRRGRALDDAGLTPADIDLIVLATSTPNNTFPATAVEIQQRLGMHARLRLRPAGRLLGLRLRRQHGRSQHSRRHGQARAGDRLGDLLAHPRLERPHHLRALRRRRGRDRAGGAAEGERHAPIAASWRPACAPTAPPRQALCRWRPLDHQDGRPSAHGGPRGLQARRRHDHRRDRGRLRGRPASRRRLDWFVPHQANKRIIDASAKKLGIARRRSSSRSTATATPRPPRAAGAHAAVADGRIKRRATSCCWRPWAADFTWGAVLLRW